LGCRLWSWSSDCWARLVNPLKRVAELSVRTQEVKEQASVLNGNTKNGLPQILPSQ
jgi:hypothetical protein